LLFRAFPTFESKQADLSGARNHTPRGRRFIPQLHTSMAMPPNYNCQGIATLVDVQDLKPFDSSALADSLMALG